MPGFGVDGMAERQLYGLLAQELSTASPRGHHPARMPLTPARR